MPPLSNGAKLEPELEVGPDQSRTSIEQARPTLRGLVAAMPAPLAHHLKYNVIGDKSSMPGRCAVPRNIYF